MSYFQPLEVVCRGSETQLQVGENSDYLPQGLILCQVGHSNKHQTLAQCCFNAAPA